ncbi:MAG: sulfate ABC transporter ATP-binding protein [Selenomonadaceae bacterium]|nr:sulfate ABC transporter ATP-binding protein [Selenomonadaceae bacterium]
MVEVEVRNVSKNFGNFKASDNVSFSVERGKLIGLLGPSGSGKTTILRMIAGLETPDSGEIFIGGRKVNNLPPGKRGIGFLFQSYALFKHMTVFDNIAFGLTVQKKSVAEIKSRVEELADLIGLKNFTHRYPLQLSGGQRQRVAFARALAPNPELLLLDEPFAAIDAKVRQELRGWLKKTIHKLGITAIFVTHDQDEAVEVADEIIITNRGRVEQAGIPVEIYQSPKTPFVAKFIGESVQVPDCSIFKGFDEYESFAGILRPEFLEIAATIDEMPQPMPVTTERGIVRGTFFRGSVIQIDIEVKGQLLKGFRGLEQTTLHEGDEAFVFIHKIYGFDGDKTTVIENAAKRGESVVI